MWLNHENRPTPMKYWTRWFLDGATSLRISWPLLKADTTLLAVRSETASNTS